MSPTRTGRDPLEVLPPDRLRVRTIAASGGSAPVPSAAGRTRDEGLTQALIDVPKLQVGDYVRSARARSGAGVRWGARALQPFRARRSRGGDDRGFRIAPCVLGRRRSREGGAGCHRAAAEMGAVKRRPLTARRDRA